MLILWFTVGQQTKKNEAVHSGLNREKYSKIFKIVVFYFAATSACPLAIFRI
jgi:hypothetical protein